ncbi:MAG: hypothetical protein KGJ87_09180 [Planctomycetota bacterium]|nr:hypothetical protein [Planctomycetota bacterium]
MGISIDTATWIGVIIAILAFLVANGVNLGQVNSVIVLAISLISVVVIISLYSINTRLASIQKGIYANNKFTELTYGAFHEITEAYNTDREMEGKKFIETFIGAVSKLSTELAKEFLTSQYRKDLSPDELHELLKKYQDNSIDAQEAARLKELLEEEKKKKEAEGDATTAILIGLLILGVVVLIIALSRRE